MMIYQADQQGSLCGDELIDSITTPDGFASLLTDPLEDVIRRHHAFSENRKVLNHFSLV